MFKGGQKLRFVKAHASMNKHLKELVGKECEAVRDSYGYGKTLVQFTNEDMKPIFNIADERLEAVEQEEQS